MATQVAKNTISNANISSEIVVLTYLYASTETKPQLLIPRVELNGIVGGGQYVLSVRISSDIMTPVSAVTVPSGQTSAVIMGRHSLAIEPGETVEILVNGQALDTDVVVISSLFDSTPVGAEDLNEILEQIQNVNIVAVKEKVILGPCQKGTTTPPKICGPSTVSSPLAAAQREVKGIPQVIKKPPLMGDE